MIFGSLLYFVPFILHMYNIDERKILSNIGLYYIVVSFIATEIYAAVKKHFSKQE